MAPMVDRTPANDDNPVGGAAWRDRAVERSTRAARQRAATRVQQFLDAARDIIVERSSIDFTVQEVVDRSKQSLRSFYQFFDGKHELLLALFEEEVATVVERIEQETRDGSPLVRLEKSVLLLHELCAPGRTSVQPLFSEFAQRLLVDHADEVATAYAPVVDHVASIVTDASDAGLTRGGRPRRLAMMVLHTATITAWRSAGGRHPLTGPEVWQFCLHAIAPDAVAVAHPAESVVVEGR